MRIFIFCFLSLTFSLNSCKKSENVSEKIYSEKIENWVMPSKENYLLFQYKMYDKSAKDISMKRKVYYLKKDSLNFGTIEATFVNGLMGAVESMAFEIYQDDKIVYLTKSKNSLEGIEKNYEKTSYFQLPPDNDTVRWNYEKGGANYECSSFWFKTTNTKQLVVVRESFINNSAERFDKTIEYYEKLKGLIKIKNYGSSDKLLMLQTIEDRGVDKTALSEHFELFSSVKTIKKPESIENSLNHLVKYKGKYAYEVKLLEDSNLKKRIIDLIGYEKYINMKSTWSVEGGIIVENGILDAAGCEAHNCDMTNFLILVDLEKDKLYIGYRIEGNVSLYGEDKNFPKELLHFEKSY